MKQTLVVIAGPTGVGKTDFSIELAKHFDTEIISCDSRQMYRELKIGTAVPDATQLAQVKHHFIGNLSIHDYYNAGEFELQALELLEHLFKSHQVVIMTGGSGLYLDAVIKGIDDLPSVDPDIRKELISQLNQQGLESLKEELKIVDPTYYEMVDLNNPKRILKALEIYRMTGKPYSSLRTDSIKERPFQIIQIGLMLERAQLYQRIDQRVDQMISDGLVEEARLFHPFKLLNSLNTVGYKELFDYFDGKYDLEEAIRLIKRNSRRYAKRQITYWNRNSDIQWFHPLQKVDMLEYIEQQINE